MDEASESMDGGIILSEGAIEQQPSYLIPGQLYQVMTQVAPFVGEYQGRLTVEDERCFEVLRDADGTFIHIRDNAIIGYFQVSEEQIAQAKRAQLMNRMAAAQAPRQLRSN